jgi:hypothetical protein
VRPLHDVLRIIGLPVVAASLCCLSPVVLVLLGLSTVSFAGSLADTLYGSYKWAFRGVGALLLIWSFILYVRSRGICTLDAVKRRRRELLNVGLLVLIAALCGYFFFLYVVVEFVGLWLGIW